MASDGPDPQSLKSWHDAFQYPIPTVRRVEQELRRDLASNKEKLRSLVGTRYRELVGTAETIVSMNREMQEVDSTLGDIGRRCNPRLMEKKYTHYNQIKGDVDEKDAEKRTLGAQLALLHRCTTSISRLLRRRSSLLLVAKLLVMSRLLFNTLSKQTPVPPFVEGLRNQLASLRQTLLNRINKRLSASASTADDIIEALAAYCLATSSSSDDAIQHFHKQRLGVIERKSKLNDPTGENVLNALRLYIRTLQSTKVLLSRRLSDVLNKLKLRPLLTDPDIRSLDDLGLDVLGRWVAADVSNFTPWIKLSELSKSDADKVIKQWSKQAFDRFAEGCRTSLKGWEGFSELLSLRQKTLELWLCSWSSTRTHSPLQVLEGLRTTFNERLTQILSDQAQSLEQFGQDVASVVSGWDKRQHAAGRSLWDNDLMSLDYSNGAGAFKLAIVDSLLGRDEDTSSALKKYEAWLSTVEKFRVDIDELRRIRWTDILEGEDEDTDVDVPATLNEDDIRLLADALQSAVREAYRTLQSSFKETFGTFSDSDRSSQAAFMLKLVRLVRQDLPTAYVDKDFLFSEDIVLHLQKLLATGVSAQISSVRSLIKVDNAAERVPGRTLWEGDPELPVQPSPATFKFLRRLVGYMDQYGPGLWDASTVQVLKLSLQDEVARSVAAAIELAKSSVAENKEESSEMPSEPNGDDQDSTDKSTAAQTLNDWKLQLYFDAAYLKNAFAVKDMKHESLDLAVEQVAGSLGIEKSSIKSVEQRAGEYWSRTQLLFGLLSE